MHGSTLLTAALIVFCCICIAYFLTPDQEFTESFLIGMPHSAQIETIDQHVLSHFAVFRGKAFDVAKLTQLAQGADATVGKSAMYQISDQNIKSVVEDVYAKRLDYTQMRHAYQSLVMAISFDSMTNDIFYFVVDTPWMSDVNVFTDTSYHVASDSSTLYVPAWKYTESDPSPFFISDDCMKLITQWESTTDSNILKQLESNACMSRQNKIRFVGLILVNYLNMLEQNSFNFEGACRQYKALANNIQNPELRGVFSKINEVCADVKGLDNDDLQTCVKAYDNWIMNDTGPGVPSDNDCFTVANKKAFLARLKKFMKIGQHIPTEYVDSFYLMVNQLYNDSKNKNVKTFLKNYQKTTADIDKWKKTLDDLMTGVVSDVDVKLNGEKLTGVSLESAGLAARSVSTNGDCIECTFPHATHLDNMMISGSGGCWISKITLRYLDPYKHKQWIDFPRVLYANEDATNVVSMSLDGIVTTQLRLVPIESKGIGFRLDFLGFPVEIRKCDQMISVCDHEKQVKASKDPYDRLQKQYSQLQQQQVSNTHLQTALQMQANNRVCKPVPKCLPCVQDTR